MKSPSKGSGRRHSSHLLLDQAEKRINKKSNITIAKDAKADVTGADASNKESLLCNASPILAVPYNHIAYNIQLTMIKELKSSVEWNCFKYGLLRMWN